MFPRGAAFFYELAADTGSGWGMGGSRVCFLIRGVESRTKPARAAKEVERIHPNPRGDRFGRG